MKHQRYKQASESREFDPRGVFERFRAAGIILSDLQLRQFATYHEELLKWNRRVNLISESDETRVVERHLLESSSLSLFDIFQGEISVVDIGTGAGFPGLPLKIVQPKIAVTLIDSKRMKMLFVQNLLQKLRLENVEAFCDRAERAAERVSCRNKYDVVVSRAVAAIAPLFSLARPFLKDGGTLVTLKGSNLTAELNELKNSFSVLRVDIRSLPDQAKSGDRSPKVVFVREM